jgi:hypothetical protein
MQIRQTKTATQRIKLLEELLLHHTKLNKPEPDYIDTAANLIIEKKWDVECI